MSSRYVPSILFNSRWKIIQPTFGKNYLTFDWKENICKESSVGELIVPQTFQKMEMRNGEIKIEEIIVEGKLQIFFYSN